MIQKVQGFYYDFQATLFRNIPGQRQLLKNNVLVRSLWWCFFTDAFDLWKVFLLSLFWLFRQISILCGIPLCSVLNIRMGYSKTHGIPRKEHLFPRNNENCSKSIPRDLSEHDFDGNPIPYLWKIKFHARYGCKKKIVEFSSL
jgi:hypothetical protein